jgi:hypothetical protein
MRRIGTRGHGADRVGMGRPQRGFGPHPERPGPPPPSELLCGGFPAIAASGAGRRRVVSQGALLLPIASGGGIVRLRAVWGSASIRSAAVACRAAPSAVYPLRRWAGSRRRASTSIVEVMSVLAVASRTTSMSQTGPHVPVLLVERLALYRLSGVGRLVGSANLLEE